MGESASPAVSKQQDLPEHLNLTNKQNICAFFHLPCIVLTQPASCLPIFSHCATLTDGGSVIANRQASSGTFSTNSWQESMSIPVSVQRAMKYPESNSLYVYIYFANKYDSDSDNEHIYKKGIRGEHGELHMIRGLWCLISERVHVFTPAGGGHLHSEGRGPLIHLSVLPADPEERLHPRTGHLLPH